jgi:amino acid adenylation domain-containing protein
MTDGFGLSPQQRRLWRLQSALGERPFRARALTRVRGGLDPGLLREAVDQVVGRHEILRTTFPCLPGLTLPVQQVAEDAVVGWSEMRDLSGLSAVEMEAALEDLLRTVEEEPFDLVHGPLLRLAPARLSSREHALVLVLPALCADAVTLRNLVREIASSYASLAGFAPGRESSDPLQYADLAEWQNELLEHEETAAGREHWEAWDPASCRALRLPFESPSAEPDRFEPGSLAVPLDGKLTQRATALAAALDTSVSTLFLATWQALLWRLTGQAEIAVGLAAECRSYEGLSESLGPLASFVPLSARLGGDLRFADAVALARDAVQAAAEWQEYFRWESVADRCGLTLEEASFPVSFAAQDHPDLWPAGPLSWELLRCEAGIDRYRLELRVHTNGGPPAVDLAWDAAAVSREDAEGMARAWRALLASAVARPEARLGELALSAPEERRHLALPGIGEGPAAPVMVHELFERQARRVPGRPAVQCGGGSLSYAELEERSGRLARLLRRHGVGPDALVAVCLERTLAMPLAVMGVLRAGGAYLPLEPALPRERKSFLLADARPQVILTETRFLADLPVAHGPVLCLDGPWEQELQDAGGEPFSRGADPMSLAYVIYTSGSTGVPKGVAVEHRQLSNYVQGTLKRLGLPEDAGYAMVSTFAADLGHTALFPSLSSGGTLHRIAEELTSDPIALATALERDPVDCLKITPSHLAALLAGAPSPWLLPRACLVLGGEASRREWVESLMALHPGLRVINEYGPTETTVGTLTYVAEPGLRLAALPLGESLAGTTTWLLGPDLEPLPAWFSGELYLGGASVARGYLGRPGLTADRFVPDPLAGAPGARMYRTGDLARRLSDGTLEFLGRADDQVKVRGFRIEPGEIETVLEGHPEVRRAAVAARDDGSGSRRLVAYVVTEGGSAVGTPELREHLMERLPEFMVPSAFVFLDALPLNTNGKVDRRALPEPDWRHLGETREFVEPETPAEVLLAGVWAEVLGVERVGAHDNFFLLGGDSIRSLVVRARAEARGVSFSVQQLFEHPVLRDLARAVAAGDVPAFGPGRTEPFGLLVDADRSRLPEGLADAYPLARLQAGMLFHSDLAPGTGVYHDIHSVRLRGSYRHDLLATAIEQVLRRHPVLRTSFDLSTFSEPLQLVWQQVPIPFSAEDLSGLPPERQRETVSSWLEAERNRGFDRSLPPLVCFHVHRLSEDLFQFTLSFHHSVLDGWSAASLLTELFRLYTALLQGNPLPAAPPPSATFRDFIELERRLLASSEARGFWDRQLDGSTLDSLPRRRTRDEEARARMLELPLPEEVDEGLKRLARVSAVPLKSALLAAHFRVLGLLTGRDDVVTGVFAHGRPESDDGDRVLGLFLNTLPLRLRLPGGTWNDLVRAVFDLERATLPFRSFPLAELQRMRGRRQLFETACNFLHYHIYQGVQEIAGLEVVDRTGYEETNFALEAQFSIQPFTGRLQLALNYRTSELDGGQVETIGGYYLRALAAMATHPEGMYDGVCLLSDAERRQLLAEWGRGGASAGPLTCFDSLFAEQTRRTPGAVAVALGDLRLTYSELDRRVDRMALALELAGVGPEEVVPLLADRGPDFLTAVLALFRAGGAYLPLDPAHPMQRTLQIVAASGARRVLAAGAFAPALARALDGKQLLILEDLLEAADRPSGGTGLPRRSLPSHLAYVIYTSGSTGVPKGAMLEQRGMVNHLWAKIAELGLDASDRVAQTASQCFDISVWQCLAPLLVGGRVQVFPDEVAHDAVRLLQEVERQDITLLETVPSLLRLLLAELDRRGEETRPAFRRLRWLIPTGEALPPDLCREWLRLYPAVPLLNAYGPTECSDDVSHHPVPTPPEPEEMRVPIGRPVPGMALYILDSWLQPLPAGVAGELLVGGVGVGRGYLGDGARTAESWCPDPFSGEPGARLYRTGDLARYRPEGAIEYLGRIDHQVKVRGQRIELGEVEAALAALADVREAVAVVREDAPGDPRLVAYVVGDATAEELRRSLRERLPDAMVPAVFVHLAALPLTPNGKVDRKALPAPDPSLSEKSYRAPRTPVEEVLAGIWADLLGLERVGADDDFFDLGGHSLLATRVMSRLRADFAVEMPLRDLFEAPTLEGLAARVETVLRDGADLLTPPLVPIAPALRARSMPLSFAQQRLWFIDQLEPGSPLYNIPVALRVAGPLRAEVLALCLGEIVRRHETLRTVIAAMGGSPVQVIQPAAPFALPLVDLSGLSERARERLAVALTGEEAARPFDLARGPLLRGVLLRLAEDEQIAALTMHHIASDGWSMGILVREVTALYAALAEGRPSPLPELSVQYADFAAWQRSWLQGEILDGEVSFWRRQLAGLPPRLELPTDRPRPAVQSFRGASRPVRLPAGLTRQLHALSRREGATLFMVLLAGFQALLARYSRQDDLAVGTPVAGRNRVEIEGLIGFFVNTLVLRADLADGPSFRKLLGRVRETALAAHTHQDVPFEKLVQELSPERSLAQTPLFQVMLVLQNAPVESVEIRDLRLRPAERAATTSKFDLTLVLQEHSGGLGGEIEHSTDLWDAATIDRLALHFETLLAAIPASPEQPVAELPLLSPAERHQLGAEWGGTAGQPATARTLHQRFEAQARHAPEARAVTCGDDAISYGTLNRQANKLALRLRKHGVGPESRVGLCLERSLSLAVGILGILKAGGAYVPLDPAYPRERLAYMIEDAGVQIVVGTKGAIAALPETAVQILLDAHRELLEELPDGDPAPLADGASLAYVIYTSGSTGRPKGTLVSHGNVARLFDATEAWFGFGERDVWTLFHSYAFDFSVWEIWGALLYGGRLVIVPYDVSRSPELFLDLLVSERVTVLNQTPSAFAQLAQADEKRGGVATDLRLVIFGGEALDPTGVAPWFARHGDERPRLVNMYGITETTVHVTYRRMRAADTRGERRSVVGVPIPDLSLAVMDRSLLQSAPIGVPGELVVGGAGLSRGYLGRPELTAERFVPDPVGDHPGARLYRSGDLGRFLPQGDVEYLGRVDQQVKIRGFRIEPGEIEAALAALAGIREAVVTVREDATGSRRLVAYVVAETGSAAGVVELRELLSGRLPDFMIPSAFVLLDALPLNANAKVDRRLLPEPDWRHLEASQEFSPPETLSEKVLARVWAEVLGLERVGAYDNFFHLGGDSIRSIVVKSRAEESGILFSIEQIFGHPVLRDLARVAGERDASSPGPEWTAPLELLTEADRARLPEDVEDAYPLASLQAGMLYHSELAPESAVYHDLFSFQLRGRYDAEVLATTIAQVARRHPALRTSFAMTGFSEPLQLVHRQAEVPFATDDLRHLTVEEGRRIARDWLGREAFHPFDWSRAPLARFQVHRFGDGSFQLTLSFHHAIFDGWSVASLLTELFRRYLSLLDDPAFPEEAPPGATLRELVHLERSALASAEAREFWRRHLDGSPLVQLPRGRADSEAADHRVDHFMIPLPLDLADGLRRVARSLSLPLKSILMAVHFRILGLLSGLTDVVSGVISNGRPERSDGDQAIGLFLNTLPLRLALPGGTWSDLAHAAAELERGALPFRRFPLAELQRMEGGRTLFETAFNFLHFHVYDSLSQLTGLDLLSRDGHEETNLSLITHFELSGASGILFMLSYQVAERDREEIEVVARRYLAALEAMAASPQAPYDTWSLFTDAEHAQIATWNRARRPLRLPLQVHAIFEAQVERTPEAVAAEMGAERLTYRELDGRAGRLAR